MMRRYAEADEEIHELSKRRKPSPSAALRNDFFRLFPIDSRQKQKGISICLIHI